MYSKNRIKNISLLHTIQLTLALSVVNKRENFQSKMRKSKD
jgi:hypothetical protein